MANTFIQLNDTPSDYLGQKGKFLRVKADETGISFAPADLNTLIDVDSTGAYAPAGGQILTYSAGAGKWRPVDNDPYSAGNGLSKTQSTLQVIATGGLVANSSGVYIADITGVEGIHGEANSVPVITVNSKGQVTHVEQVAVVADDAKTLTTDYVKNLNGTIGAVRVTNGTGVGANTTIDLVATGVSAGTYGNATHSPVITVDSYGRVQNVDLVQSVGNGSGGSDTGVSAEDAYNMHKYFKTIRVGGVRNKNNEVYGVDVSAEKPQDILYIESLHGGLLLSPNANSDSLNFDIDAGAIAADIAIGDLTDVDTAGATDGDVLIWSGANNRFEVGKIGGDDSVIDLTDFSVTTTSANGGGALSYNNNGVFAFAPADLSAYATQTYVDNAVANAGGNADSQTLAYNSSNKALAISDGNSVSLETLEQTLSLVGNIITISGSSSSVDLSPILGTSGGSNYSDSDVQAYLDAQGYSNTDNDSQTLSLNNNQLTISNGNSVDLSSLSVDLTGYATESFVETAVQSVIDGANINLDTLAEVANALGNSNTAISTVAFTGDFDDLTNRPTITLDGTTLSYDGVTLDIGTVQGPTGDTGATGATGATGPQGPAGADGSNGVGITSAQVTNGDLILTYSNTSVQNLGDISGPQGIQGTTGAQGPAGNDGADGLTVTGASVVSEDLIITLSDSSTINAGNVVGPAGATGAQGPQGIQGATGADGADGQDGVSVSTATVNGSGNLIITLTDASTVDAGNVRGADGAGTDTQTLSLTGTDLTISNGNTIDLSGLGGGGSGTTYTGDTGITVDNSANTIALANTTVSPGTYGSATRSPVITVDQQGRITGIQNATISGGGGGGGGASVERFKLNYTSSGALAGTSDLSAGIAGVTINSTSGGEVTVEFTGFNLPPGSIMFYGYDYTNNKYVIVPMETSMGFREIPAGGSSGTPTLFDGSDTLEVKLRLREAETGASRGGFGTTTHAWIQFVMYD